MPLRLKASIGGYDGRGQVRIASADDLEPARRMLDRELDGGRPMLLERELPFDMEFSVIVARGRRRRDGRLPDRPERPRPGDPRRIVDAGRTPGRRPRSGRCPWPRTSPRGWAWSACSRPRCSSCPTARSSSTSSRRASTTAATGRSRARSRASSSSTSGRSAACPSGRRRLRTGGAATVNLLGTGPDRAASIRGIDAALELPDVHLHVVRQAARLRAAEDGPRDGASRGPGRGARRRPRGGRA